MADLKDRDQPGFGKTFFGLGPARAATAADDARRRKWAVAGAGTELAAGIGLFAGLGYLVDRWLGSLPWGTVVGALLGMAAGMYLLIKAVAAANEADADDAARRGGKG